MSDHLERVSATLASGNLPSTAASADPDAALVAAAKGGSTEAFEELVNRNEARIFRLAQNITQNREDAEEVVQNSLVNVFRHLNSFQGDSLFSTWLTRVVVNQALMLLRKRRPGTFSLDELIETQDEYIARELADWSPTPEQQYAEKELQEILSRELAQLSASHRIVFQLRDIEQFSIEETSKMLGISIPAVKSRTMRARLDLRERLAKYFGRREKPFPTHNGLASQAAYAC